MQYIDRSAGRTDWLSPSPKTEYNACMALQATTDGATHAVGLQQLTVRHPIHAIPSIPSIHPSIDCLPSRSHPSTMWCVQDKLNASLQSIHPFTRPLGSTTPNPKLDNYLAKCPHRKARDQMAEVPNEEGRLKWLEEGLPGDFEPIFVAAGAHPSAHPFIRPSVHPFIHPSIRSAIQRNVCGR